MKHATSQALRQIEELLEQLRTIAGLTERKPGVFYRGASAFLHFHEDPAGLFADLKSGGSWLRVPVNTPHDKDELLARVKSAQASRRK